MAKQINVLVKVEDWEKQKSTFVAPTLSDAVAGISEIIAAAVLHHEINGTFATTNSERVLVELFKTKMEAVEEGFRAIGPQEKLVDLKLVLWPKRFVDVPAAKVEETKEKPLVELN